MDKARVQELSVMQRVLGALVVVLAFSTGWLIVERQHWFRTTPNTPTEQPLSLPVFTATGSAVLLPKPSLTSSVLEQTLAGLLPQRNFSQKPLTLAQISQLLWAAYGVNTSWGERTVPSYKSAYPLRLTVIAKRVDALPTGVYRFDPVGHNLRPVESVDLPAVDREFTQPSMQTAPLLLTISADVYAYQNLAKQADAKLLFVEAGHVSQNIFLTGTRLGLGMVEISTIDQEKTKQLFHLPNNEAVLLMLPVGIPEEKQ